jgi:hypothetical protein
MAGLAPTREELLDVARRHSTILRSGVRSGVHRGAVVARARPEIERGATCDAESRARSERRSRAGIGFAPATTWPKPVARRRRVAPTTISAALSTGLFDDLGYGDAAGFRRASAETDAQCKDGRRSRCARPFWRFFPQHRHPGAFAGSGPDARPIPRGHRISASYRQLTAFESSTISS